MCIRDSSRNETHVKQWTLIGESAPKKAKVVPLGGKFMAPIFWDAKAFC